MMPPPLSTAVLSAASILLLVHSVCASHRADRLLDQEPSIDDAQQDQSSPCDRHGISDAPTIGSPGMSLLGGNVTLTCVYPLASLRPPEDFHYHWFKDGQPVAGQQSRTLSLYNLSSSHQGDYTCRASDWISGRPSCISRKFSLSVVVPPEAYIEQGYRGTYSVVEGDDLNLTCRISNKPEPPVKTEGFTWTFQNLEKGLNFTSASSHDRREIDLGPSRDTESIPGVNHLTFRAVTRLYSGRYTCHVTNDPGDFRGIPPGTARVEVRVQYLDNSVAVSVMAQKPLVIGNNVTLTCRVDSIPTANLTWLHQGRVLHTVESNEDVYSFTATGCQNSGEYQCRADNDAVNKSFSYKTALEVQCPPTKNGSSDPEPSRLEGEGLTLWVGSVGFPPPVHTWSGPALQTVRGTSTRILSNLTLDQSGVYTVNVSNQHGWFCQSFNLTVRHRATEGTGGDVVGGNAGEATLWLKVGGGLLAALLLFAFVCLTVVCKWRVCCYDQENAFSSHVQQYLELCSRGHQDNSGRRRSQEVGDYTSGESTGHYWSIHSADLSWQPQAVQPQDSLSQVPAELHYDVPAAARRHPAPKPGCVGCQPAPDVTDTAYITPVHDGGNDTIEGVSPSQSSSSAESRRHSSQESDSSEAYCVCDVIRGDSLAADSSAQQEDRSPPQGAADVTADSD